MALINDNRLYSGGSQVVDTRPHVQLYAQLKAREQARNDAFDEYMRNVNLKINPAGMRYQDMPAFEHGLKQMQEFGIKNREAIQNPRKDGGLAAMQFQQLYQKQQNRIAESKMASEGLKPFIDVQADPKKSRLLNKERAMRAVQSHDQPQEIQDETGEFIRNPKFVPFNSGELEFKEDSFDIPKYLKSLDYIKPTDTIEEVGATDPKTLMRKVKKTSRFKQDDYDKMASIGVQTYYSDPSMKQLVDEMYNDPNNTEVVRLNELYKSKFGEDIKSEGDLAAAITIAGKETSEEEVKDVDDKFAQDKALEAFKNKNRRGLLLLRDSLKDDPVANDLWIDEYVDRVTTDSKKPENRTEYKYKDGRVIKGYKVALDPVLSKSIGFDQKNTGQLIVTDEGDFIIAPFETDDNYKPIKGADNKYAINPEGSQRISQDQLKLSLGKTSAGTKQTNVEMNQPSPKKKKTDDPLNLFD